MEPESITLLLVAALLCLIIYIQSRAFRKASLAKVWTYRLEQSVDDVTALIITVGDNKISCLQVEHSSGDVDEIEAV